MQKTTESDSNYDALEKMSTANLLQNINREDKTVAHSVENQIPQIEKLVNVIVTKMKLGGRLFYLGAGTSGRLGIVDASECPPTFGVDHDLVIGLMAGGDKAMRKAVEFAEDNTNLGWKDLQSHNINDKDLVVGLQLLVLLLMLLGLLKDAKIKRLALLVLFAIQILLLLQLLIFLLK